MRIKFESQEKSPQQKVTNLKNKSDRNKETVF